MQLPRIYATCFNLLVQTSVVVWWISCEISYPFVSHWPIIITQKQLTLIVINTNMQVLLTHCKRVFLVWRASSLAYNTLIYSASLLIDLNIHLDNYFITPPLGLMVQVYTLELPAATKTL